MRKLEFKQLKKIFIIPVSFVLIMWIVKLVESSFDINLMSHGVFPQTFSGLQGIFFSPFIHSDFTHLFLSMFGPLGASGATVVGPCWRHLVMFSGTQGGKQEFVGKYVSLQTVQRCLIVFRFRWVKHLRET